jgi:hypothetical protein
MALFLEDLMIYINKLHDYLFLLSNNLNLTDKQLHFIFMGIIGMIIFLIILPLFKYLAKKSIIAIGFIYSFTCLVAITFAVEIGQEITGGGSMEFLDIAYGLYGFFVLFIIYLIISIMKKNRKKNIH